MVHEAMIGKNMQKYRRARVIEIQFCMATVFGMFGNNVQTNRRTHVHYIHCCIIADLAYARAPNPA